MFVDLFGGCSLNPRFNEELNQLEGIVNHDSPRQVAQQFTKLLLNNSPPNTSSVTPEKLKIINKKLAEIFRQEPRSCQMAKKLCNLFEENDRRASGLGEETDALYSKLEHVYMHETPNNRFQNQMRKFLGSDVGQGLNDVEFAQNLCRILHAHIKFANDFGQHLSRAHQAAIQSDDIHNQNLLQRHNTPKRTLETCCEGKVSAEESNVKKQRKNIGKQRIVPKQVKIVVRCPKGKQQNMQKNSNNPQNVSIEKHGNKIPKKSDQVPVKCNPKIVSIKFVGTQKPVLKMAPAAKTQVCLSKVQEVELRNSEQDTESTDYEFENLQINARLKKRRVKHRKTKLKTAIDASVKASIKAMFPKINKKIVIRPIKKKFVKKLQQKPVRLSKLCTGVQLICPVNHEIRKKLATAFKAKRKSK